MKIKRFCDTCKWEDKEWYEQPCEDCTGNDDHWEPKEGERMSDQNAKADAGKLQLTLVPRQIIKDIAQVRMYGNEKYGDPDNWKDVEPERYRDAAFRHFLAYLDDPQGVDPESGISHLSHLACNIAFLCAFEHGRRQDD